MMFGSISKNKLTFIITILLIIIIIGYWIFSIFYNEPPIADAGDNITVDTNQLILISGYRSKDHDGSIKNYTWEFSDGYVAYGKNVTRIFSDNGNYSVTLTVIDNEGAEGRDEIDITVKNVAPLAQPTIKQYLNKYIKPPSLFRNYTASPPWYKITNYSSESLIYTFDTLYLDASESYDTDGHITNYTWHFDDGGVRYGIETTYYLFEDGIHVITLRTIDDDGATSYGNVNISITNRPPFAYIGPDTIVNKNENITLNASLPLPLFSHLKSYDPDGQIVNYTWDFGEGNFGFGETVTHNYHNNGTYHVTLKVRDDDGAENSDTAVIIVSNVQPIAFAGQYKIGNISEPVIFNGTGYDEDGYIVLYEWDFNGDSIFDWNSTMGNTSHIFNTMGIYPVTMRVTDNDGGIGIDTIKIYIGNETSYPPIALAEISHREPENYSLFHIYKIFCNGSESINLDNDNLSFYWDFGDGNGKEGMIVNHTYPMGESTEYEVTFTVSGSEFTDMIIFEVIIDSYILDYREEKYIYIYEKI